MVKRTVGLVSACALLGTLGGCGSDDGDDNGAPVISDLSADRDAVVAQIGTANLTVEASDPDGDPLEYAWSVTLGAVAAAGEPGMAVLTAPGERGTATVTVTVTDGKGGEAQQSLDLGVVGWTVPASATTVPVGVTFNALSFADADNGVAVGGSDASATANVPYIYRYSGGAWTDETVGTAGHLTATSAIAPNDMWTAGGGGLAFHFDGAEWFQFSIPGGCVHGMDFLNANDIWVTPAEGQAYMRRYSGGAMNAWTEYTAPANGGMNGTSIVSETDGWAVGNGGTVFRFNGTAWESFDAGTYVPLYGVDMVSADDGWMVGGNGTSLHWDGQAWSKIDTPAGAAVLHGVYAVATDDVWAVGSGGMIIHYDGMAWTQVPSPVAADLTAVSFPSPSDGWVVGYEGTILHLE